MDTYSDEYSSLYVDETGYFYVDNNIPDQINPSVSSSAMWLKKRLSPVKDSNDRWIGIATSLQTFWEDNFDPIYNSLVSLRSVYTMSPEDLAMKMRENGDFFSPDWPTEFDQPLAVAWREGEIIRKNTDYILTSTFRRNFGNMGVKWLPLYAPKVGEYGSRFITETATLDPGESLDDFWLTSRGKISVDLESMYSMGRTMISDGPSVTIGGDSVTFGGEEATFGGEPEYVVAITGITWDKSTFLPVVDRILKKIKPEHIVYEGIIFQWDGYIPVNMTYRAGAVVTKSLSISVSFEKRYDIIRADVATTDSSSEDLTITQACSLTLDISPDYGVDLTSEQLLMLSGLAA